MKNTEFLNLFPAIAHTSGGGLLPCPRLPISESDGNNWYDEEGETTGNQVVYGKMDR